MNIFLIIILILLIPFLLLWTPIFVHFYRWYKYDSEITIPYRLVKYFDYSKWKSEHTFWEFELPTGKTLIILIYILIIKLLLVINLIITFLILFKTKN
jgi:hypothetical protein